MAKVGAQRAAELTGKSKSTIQRAMKQGKISYEMDGNGRRVIDVSELERAFGLMPQDTDGKDKGHIEAELEKATQMLEMERLKMKIKMLEEQVDTSRNQIEDLKEQRDQWQKQAQQVLLTSQYSQKQAEELKEELKERERRARMRRQQYMEQQQLIQQQKQRGSRFVGKTAVADKSAAAKDNAENIGPIEHLRRDGLNIQGLWQKIRGQQDDKQAEDTAGTAEAAAQTDVMRDKAA